MNKMSVKDLTLGAIIGAIYGVLMLIARIASFSFDSLVFYFVPIPIAIYTYLKGYKTSLVLLFVMIALSFLIIPSWIDVLVLAIPNLIIGYAFGVLKPKLNNGLTILIIFLLSIGACYLSFISLKINAGLSFLEYTKNDLESFNSFFNLPDIAFTRVISIVIPVVIFLDSLIKSIMIFLVFIILVRTLKIDANIKLKINIEPNIYLSIISFFLTILTIFITILIFKYDALNNLNLLLSLLYVITFILVVDVAYKFLSFICHLVLIKKGRSLMVIIYFLMILLLPITYLGGLIYPFIYPKMISN